MTRSSDDRFKNAVDIAEHVVVPETQNKVAISLQICCSSRILSGEFGVLPTIKLKDQTSGLATEIHHIGFDQHLPSKLQPIEPAISQSEPQCAFSVGLIATESSGCANTRCHNPSPALASRGHPLPSGEGRICWSQPQQVANRIDKVGAIHCVEVECRDTTIDKVEDLFGGDCGGNQLACGRILIEALETIGNPCRHRGAAALREPGGSLE